MSNNKLFKGIILFLFYFIFCFSYLNNNYNYNNFINLADNGTYNCFELQKWLKIEKHYSNERKNSLFDLLLNNNNLQISSNNNNNNRNNKNNKNDNNLNSIFNLNSNSNSRSNSNSNSNTENSCNEYPVIKLNNIIYTQDYKTKQYFNIKEKNKKCFIYDKIVIFFFSNFSINHNYSHFLHSLLRLFCSLIDMRLLIWDSNTSTFIKQSNYTIWMDENFKLSSGLMEWMKPFGNIKHLQTLPKGECASAKTLYYGSGCVKLLPPEKWFGYPGCRANQILPAFSTFIKSYHSVSTENLPIVQITTSNIKPNHNSNSHSNSNKIQYFDESSSFIGINQSTSALNIVFGVRRVGSLTGTRTISNLSPVSLFID